MPQAVNCIRETILSYNEDKFNLISYDGVTINPTFTWALSKSHFKSQYALNTGSNSFFKALHKRAGAILQ